MFEQFTAEAREIVVAAQDAARELGHDRIGCEHLLLALADGAGAPAADALAQLGAGSMELRQAVLEVVGPCTSRPDPDALRALGIDLEEVRRRAEERFGPGALERTRAGRSFRTHGSVPFTPRAKHALHLALEAAQARRDRHICGEHVLLGILDQGENVGLLVLERLGLGPATVRVALLARLERDAA